MAKTDEEQKSVNVRQHARLAMGVKLDGTSYQAKGDTNSISKSKPKGGLAHVKKK